MNGFFTSYIGSVAAVSLTALICELICSSNTEKKMTRPLNLIISLCVFLTVTMPVIGALQKFSKEGKGFETFFSEPSQQTSDTFFELWKKQTENGICDAVFQKTGIKPSSVSIDLIVDEQNTAIIEKVKVEVENINQVNESTLVSAVTEIVGNQAEIYISESKNEN